MGTKSHSVDPIRHSRAAVLLATATLLFAYVATSGFGAALFASKFGQEQLAASLWPETINFDPAILGSPWYWTILLSLMVIVPITALVVGSVVGRFAPNLAMPKIPIGIPIALAALMTTYCIYKLVAAGALSAQEAWDRSVCYDGKILRRVELIGLLGNYFYGMVYSSLPVLGCYFLARGVMEKDRISLIACAILSAFILWFNFAILFKTAAVIYVGMLGATLWLSGFGFWRSATLATVAAGTLYVGLSMMQFCVGQAKSWERTIPASGQLSSDPHRTVPSETVPSEKGLFHKAGYMARAALFRMAGGIPYYLESFRDPQDRCGIVRPPSRWWSGPNCFAPIVIFRKMYPTVTYTTGYQPAPLNVSAYAEAGPWYVLFATVASGIVLGGLAALARDRSPLSIAVVIASCVYAYYVTQTSLTGSLIDSYGLMWLLLPIVAIVAIHRIISPDNAAKPYE